jgi:hypothetical protein
MAANLPTLVLVDSAMQYRLVLLYSHIDLLGPEQSTHHMLLGFNSYMYRFRLVFEHP